MGEGAMKKLTYDQVWGNVLKHHIDMTGATDVAHYDNQPQNNGVVSLMKAIVDSINENIKDEETKRIMKVYRDIGLDTAEYE